MNLSDILSGGTVDNITETVDISSDMTLSVEEGVIYNLNVLASSIVLTISTSSVDIFKSILVNDSYYDIKVVEASKVYNLESGSSLIYYWNTGLSSSVSKNSHIPELYNWGNAKETKIQASDKQAGDQFGIHSSISDDGNTVIISGGHSDTRPITRGAYIYTYSLSGWSEEIIVSSDNQLGDWFGFSVDISSDGNTCVVGALGEDTKANVAGAVYVFVRSGNTWTQEAKLMASDAQAGDEFGYAVTLSGDGNTCAVGAVFEDTVGTNGGAIYIYNRSGSTWTQQQKHIANDGAAYDYFGDALELSSDASTLIVDAPGKDTSGIGTNTGAVYVLTRTGLTYTEAQTLEAPIQHESDTFSRSAISDNGDTIVVGAFGEDAGGVDAGAVYVFVRSGNTWTQEAKLMASDAQAGDNFGNRTAITGNGNTIVVGARGEDTGGVDAGAVYVFDRVGSVWSQQTKLQSSDKQAGDHFGGDCSISGIGKTIIVTASYEDTGGVDAGAAYIFEV